MLRTRPSKDRWPKTSSPLIHEPHEVNVDFVMYWHEVLTRRYQFAERLSYIYVVKSALTDFETTLEAGAGLGEHLNYGNLSAPQLSNYVAVDSRESMVDVLTKRYAQVRREMFGRLRHHSEKSAPTSYPLPVPLKGSVAASKRHSGHEWQ
jgi:hypothetical protein